MVFVSNGCPEHRENAIPGGLRNVAAVAAASVDHQVQRRINDPSCLFRIEAFHQLGRASDVGEQRGDRLALALERFVHNPGAYLYPRARIRYRFRFAASTLERLRTFEAELCR